MDRCFRFRFHNAKTAGHIFRSSSQGVWPGGQRPQADESVSEEGKSLPPRLRQGFLLMDSSLRPVSFNAEAIEILSLFRIKHPGLRHF